MLMLLLLNVLAGFNVVCFVLAFFRCLEFRNLDFICCCRLGWREDASAQGTFRTCRSRFAVGLEAMVASLQPMLMSVATICFLPPGEKIWTAA